MTTSIMRLATALGLASALALSATTDSFAQNHKSSCILHYNSSDGQTVPYC